MNASVSRVQATGSTARFIRPGLSVVLLTLDEEDNVVPAVRSLLEQTGVDLEVVVVDSASRDATVPRVKGLVGEDPRVRLVPSETWLSVGRARNLGVQHARAPRVAFMSADAVAGPGWARAAVEALEEADVVYGRQEHAPARGSVAAFVRGLRYHHFDRDVPRPASSFASNVNAAVRRRVFDAVRYVDDGPAGALDDILFTKEAESLGFRVAYRRDMRVEHKDAATLGEELVKNRREGHGWGLLAPRLGLHHAILVWGALLTAASGTAVVLLHPAAWFVVLLVLYAPALRRAARGLHMMKKGPVAWSSAVVVSPFFDLAFLVAYLHGLRRRRDVSGVVRPQGA